MNSILLRILPYMAALAIVAGALFGAYHHGLSVKDAEWQAKWSDRDTRDAEARAANESAARVREQAYQHSIDKAVQDGQRTIDQLTADAAAARVSSDGLRGAADALAARLAASQAGGNSCTAATSQAATRAVLVFADVLKRADQRAGDLAGYADQSRSRGVTCETAFDALGK
ncbi:DUF2514 family protein [Pseudomonas mediterranea]|uniref:DUF2514 family protein n=1 Tax=Pseudomonas mediterranea TaxID=183795 RepID=A0AAX2DIL4_9PSED|nr:DUF2514 family protein [Pseudomonas mediterranea]KGU84815.1 hypothetical protein N005_15740 [Pseudomonas mediterranea CFBP 5447]SDU74571.1 Protein of unknown function [Pseudomonas mediterranea]